jgi:hypothetical protein
VYSVQYQAADETVFYKAYKNRPKRLYRIKKKKNHNNRILVKD